MHRQANESGSKNPAVAQRSMLQRVRHAYDKFFKEGKGRPRFKPAVDSFELEGYSAAAGTARFRSRELARSASRIIGAYSRDLAS